MKLKEVEHKLRLLYGDERGTAAYKRLLEIGEDFRRRHPALSNQHWLTEQDVMLITYGDSILDENQAPLRTLTQFAMTRLKDLVSAVHILPFYPYSSDDGFSVIDYWQVNPKLGTWEDIAVLAQGFDLMFDAVVNHISAQSDWFQNYLQGDPEYAEYFIECDPGIDLSQVTRPRALPLLTPVETTQGTKHVWTTFSADQIDLNYKNEEVLLKIIELLLFYVSRGARYIRLDAIGYLWKEIGTNCIHLPQTHWVIQIMRAVLDELAPGTILITETNVPHEDNISYFGDGSNEAHMVYQFPLPPLVLYTFLAEDSAKLTTWAAELKPCSPQTTFFNFLASHDGIGVMPVQGILDDTELEFVLEKVIAHGGLISHKTNPDGSLSPYELNINYLSALSAPSDSTTLKAKRFLAAQAILLSLQGVPGIYVHSLLGSENYIRGFEESGIKRRINREKLNLAELEAELDQPGTLRNVVFTGYSTLLKIRRSKKAFHPNSSQRILDLGKEVFSLIRGEGEEQILCLINISSNTQIKEVDWQSLGLKPRQTDLISNTTVYLDEEVVLEPYQVMWLK